MKRGAMEDVKPGDVDTGGRGEKGEEDADADADVEDEDDDEEDGDDEGGKDTEKVTGGLPFID